MCVCVQYFTGAVVTFGNLPSPHTVTIKTEQHSETHSHDIIPILHDLGGLSHQEMPAQDGGSVPLRVCFIYRSIITTFRAV